MHKPLPRLLMSTYLVASGVTSATQMISLSNFTPRIENLPSSCQAAYTTTIESCQASDFATGARCSASCVQGLIKIASLVDQQCGTVDVPETSIIGVFLLGQGVQALCPGVTVVTAGPSSTAAPPASSNPAPQVSNTPDPQPSSGDPSASSTTLATSAVDTPNQSVAPPTSTAGQPQLTLATGSPPPVPSQTASSQKSNKDSGGGSPFDVQATGLSPQLQRSSIALTALLGVALLAVTFL